MLFPLLEQIKQFDNHIRQLYTNSKYLVDDDSWPPFTPNKFISLLLIHHLENQLVKHMSTGAINMKTSTKNQQTFTTNNISDIFQHGENVEVHKKMILILGVPGIGKTILSKEIAYQWATKTLLSEEIFVLMIFLRDPNIKRIKDLKDLVHYFYGFSENANEVSTACASYLFQLMGSKVTIIFDGLDEISIDLIDNTYIKLLLDRNALPYCRIVVTSRPVESARFRTKADIEVEIIGFTEENIQAFINNELKEDKQKKLMNYLQQNESLHHLCYIPFIISVLVCIVKESDELPANQGEVYEKFVLFTISRFLQKIGHLNCSLSNIDELPLNYKSYFLDLCKYAFTALENDQVVFTRKEAFEISPKFADAPEAWYGLGLLETIKYFNITENNDCVIYNFLHKSVQEYLAAIYIAQLSQQMQFTFIKKYFFHEKYLSMWIMYIGLGRNLFSFWHFLSGHRFWIQSKWFKSKEISKKILCSKIHCLYLFHCFSELKDSSMCDLVGTLFQLGKLDLSNCTISINDINTMIFILDRSTTTHWSKLNLSYCNINDAGCQHLCKHLSKLNHKIYFDEINIENNLLSLDSVQCLVNLLQQCGTKKVFPGHNGMTRNDAGIAYFVMQYSFVNKMVANRLLVMVEHEERAIFCQSENSKITEYLKNSRHMVTGLYFINCQLNDETIEQISDVIKEHRMIMNLCFWNSNISEDYLKNVLAVMPQENHNQLLFVYDTTNNDIDVVHAFQAFMTFIYFTFIFVSKKSLFLYNVSYHHINLLSFYNPIFCEMNLITIVCLSNCSLRDNIIELLVQLLNHCNSISTLLLMNNDISQYNLNKLIDAVGRKKGLPSGSLRKVTIHQNNMTEYNLFLLEDKLKKVQLLLMNNEILLGYKCSDEQLKYASLRISSVKLIIIQYSHITYHTLAIFEELFKQSVCLQIVAITHASIDSQTANKLLQHMSIITTLRKLNLEGNNLTEQNAVALASVISSNTGLEHLYLNNNYLQLGITGLKNISSLKVLDLQHNSITEQAVNSLVATISGCRSLEKLWLNGNHLGPSTAVVINALKEISSLKQLNLNYNKSRSEELASVISSVVAKNKSMEKLLLSDNGLNDDGVIRIAESLCKHSKLKTLNLQNNNITEKAAGALASVISSNSGLEQIYLGNNQLQLGVIKIARELKKLSTLKVLDLISNGMTEQVVDELVAAIRINKSLEKLWLNNNHLRSSTVVVVNDLKEISSLTELYLNDNTDRIKELAPAISSVLAKNKLLGKLSLRDNGLNDDGVIKIAQSLCKHSKLKALNLQNNNITEKAAEALASVISSNTELQKLYLGNNQLQLGVIKIARGLKNISSLKVLDLSNNNITEQAADELAAAIRFNKSLEEIWLSSNYLRSSAIVVVNALQENSSLKELYLNDNKNRSEELAPVISSVVTKNLFLRILALSDNGLNDSGVIKIAQSLCKCSKLKVLNLQNNNITEKAAEALASVISSNSGLEKLYLGNNQLQLGIIEIAKRLKDISSLKVLDLSNNNITKQVADELVATIKISKSLEKLWLNGNHLGSSAIVVINAVEKISLLKELCLNDSKNRSEELAPAISSVVAKNKSLEVLSLRDNGLNDDGVIKISESLCKCSKLKVLNLQNNNITEKAAEALAYIISSNRGLEEIYLGNNQLQLGVIKIAKRLKDISSLKVLDLSNNNISEQAADELAAVIKISKSLEKLWLDGNHLGSSTIVVIIALQEISSLRQLYLNDSKNRSEELAPAISSVVAKNKSLEVLSLRDNGLNDDSVITIAQSLCDHSKLKALNLQNNNITEKAAEALASVISCNSRLEKLCLGNNQLQLGVIKIARGVKNISSLKVLDLSNNYITEQAVDELVAAIRISKSLEEIWLNSNYLRSSTIVVVNALQKISSLKELSLNDNKNRSEKLAPVISTVVTKNLFLEILALGDNGLNDDGAIKIAESLCKCSKLKVLNLQNNNITEKSAEVLASVISSNSGLEKLYVGNNQLQLGVIKIATGLKNISSLKVLDLSNNNITEQAVDELAAAIRISKSLEKLWLDGNHLGSSAVVVMNSLEEISLLKELCLNDNKNRSEELAPAISSVVAKNKSLEVLSLRDNGLNDDGVIKIAESLCKCSKLKVLNLQNNNITEKAAPIIASVISSNSGLQKLYLGNNQLQLGVIKIASGLKIISSLKALGIEENYIPRQAINDLSDAIRANSFIDKLLLSDNYLGSSMAVIARACCNNSHLKQFYIKNTGISEAEAGDLAAVIRCNSSIEILSLSDNDLQSLGFTVIAQALKVTSSLKRLYAHSINITSTVSEELSSVIDLNLLLENISIRDNLLENGLLQIVESCSNLKYLKILELSHNCISPAQVVNLASIISKSNSVEVLSFDGICLNVNESLYLNVWRTCNTKICNEARNSLMQEKMFLDKRMQLCCELMRWRICQTPLLHYGYSNFVYQYWKIYISYQHRSKFDDIIENNVDYKNIVQGAKQKLLQVNSKAMMSSLQIIRKLKLINLENNNIDEDAAMELAGHLHCNNVLEQLWLRGNELYDKGASAVLQSLHNLSTLLILDLSFNHLSSESADGIAVVVSSNCSLQQLWLDGNNLLTRGVVVIASALKKLSSLRILSVCSNGITDGAADEISDVITSNVLLVDLLLGNNHLQASGICIIAIALRKLLMLRRLDLFNNHITPDAVELLAVTLSKCTNLQQLFLNDNMLGTEGTIKIANALQCVNSLQVLTLSNNNITESTADVLAEVLKNNTSLKILFIGGNNLQTSGIKLIVQTAKNVTTLQLLDVSDNNVSEDEKENFKAIFASNSNCIIVV